MTRARGEKYARRAVRHFESNWLSNWSMNEPGILSLRYQEFYTVVKYFRNFIIFSLLWEERKKSMLAPSDMAEKNDGANVEG